MEDCYVAKPFSWGDYTSPLLFALEGENGVIGGNNKPPNPFTNRGVAEKRAEEIRREILEDNRFNENFKKWPVFVLGR